MKILYLDESGDHDLINIDKNYPIFVLAGCILDVKEDEKLEVELANFKKDLFNSKNIILHYAGYTRNKNGFESMKDKNFREEFYRQFNKIIINHEYILLACIVDKNKHNKKYGINAKNPYLLSLDFIVERFVFYLKESNDEGIIIAESRDKQLDNELELAYLNLKIAGTRYLKAKDITNVVEGFFIKKKAKNIAGLQFIDSIITPIGRRYLRLRNYYLNYENIKSRFRRSSCGKYMGYGLVLFP